MLEKKQKIFMLTDNKHGLRYIFLSYDNVVDESVADSFEDIFTNAKDNIEYEIFYSGLTECGYTLDILAERRCVPDVDEEREMRVEFATLADQYSISLSVLNQD